MAFKASKQNPWVVEWNDGSGKWYVSGAYPDEAEAKAQISVFRKRTKSHARVEYRHRLVFPAAPAA